MSVFLSRSLRVISPLTFSQGGSPLLQQGELDFSPAKKRRLLRKGFSAGIFCSRVVRTVLPLITLATTITISASAQSLPETVEAINKARVTTRILFITAQDRKSTRLNSSHSS